MRPTLTRLTHPRRPVAPPRRQHGPRARALAESAHALAETLGPERRARDAGGPQDHACYSCECGYVFHASVSTSVTCPHCGQGQAW